VVVTVIFVVEAVISPDVQGSVVGFAVGFDVVGFAVGVGVAVDVGVVVGVGVAVAVGSALGSASATMGVGAVTVGEVAIAAPTREVVSSTPETAATNSVRLRIVTPASARAEAQTVSGCAG
jgi:hypothetical protein